MHAGKGSAQAEREQLIAELERVTDEVSAAIDDAAVRADSIAQLGLGRLRELSGQLLERATELDREIAALAKDAERAANALRGRPDEPEFEPLPDLDSLPEPAPLPAALSDLDDVERMRESVASAPVAPPRARRFRLDPLADDPDARPED